MENTFDGVVECLKRLGVEFTVEQDWRPKNPPRKPYPLPFFTNICIPLSPTEWCSLVMREGESYIGGCCGTASYVQDIVAHAFRFGSGWIDMKALADMAEAMSGHEEGDPPSFRDVGNLDNAVWQFTTLDPWGKIATLWHLTKDYYVPEYPYAQREELSDPERAVRTLENGLKYLSLQWLFKSDSCTTTQVGSVHQVLALNRILPPLKLLYDRIGELDPGPFSGYALFHKESGAIAENGYGLCVFATEQDAEKLMEQWRSQWALREDKRGGEKPIDDIIKIRPVRISMENGVEFPEDSI